MEAKSKAALALVLAVACKSNPEVVFESAPGSATSVRRPALYPETIEYDARRQQFLLSSLREGAIFRVDQAGNARALVQDPRLCSVLGIALDAKRDRLWAVSSDLGVSLKPSVPGPKQLAAVAFYDAESGAARGYVDIASLLPGPHLLNGVAVDAATGDAYVTDSFQPAIYRVSSQGQASVFLKDVAFTGDGINLNGLVVHPDGYLLVIKKSDGALFKVPLGEPQRFSQVQLDRRFVGGDGLTLVGTSELVVIANQTPQTASNSAYALASHDAWRSAQLRETLPLGDVYPTTAVLRDNELFVLHSKLNELILAPKEQQAGLRLEASIRKIAGLAR